MTEHFQAGDVVALTQDYPDAGLKAGAVGTIWVRYETHPPMYEVTLHDADGMAFDMTLSEKELVLASQSHDARTAANAA